jgi:D-sedoheptulose 7-phosphate isomerase
MNLTKYSSITSYINHHNSILKPEIFNKIQIFVKEIEALVHREGILWVVGNGGSASTASHFCTDLSVGGLDTASQVRAIALNDFNSSVTASANDYGIEEMFNRTFKALSKPENDLIMVISASGNSRNLIKILEESQIKSLGLIGFRNSNLEKLLDEYLNLDLDEEEYGMAEDLHLAICHVITYMWRFKKLNINWKAN